jgi:hypothetical protein
VLAVIGRSHSTAWRTLGLLLTVDSGSCRDSIGIEFCFSSGSIVKIARDPASRDQIIYGSGRIQGSGLIASV